MTGAQVMGTLLGAALGFLIGVSVAGGRYRYLGGPLWEETSPPKGCFQGCLIQLLLTALGAGAGFVVGSLAGG